MTHRERDLLRKDFAADTLATVRRQDMQVAAGQRTIPQTHEELVQRLESLTRHLHVAPMHSRAEWMLEIAALMMQAGVSARRAEQVRVAAFADPRGAGDGLGGAA